MVQMGDDYAALRAGTGLRTVDDFVDHLQSTGNAELLQSAVDEKLAAKLLIVGGLLDLRTPKAPDDSGPPSTVYETPLTG